MKFLYLLLIVPLILQCLSNTSTPEQSAQEVVEADSVKTEEPKTQAEPDPDRAAFEDFLNLFEDITPYVGDMDSWRFPLDGEQPEQFQESNRMPVIYHTFIDTSSEALDFCQNHLREGHGYFPLYRFDHGSITAVILYYSVPEVPRSRIRGTYYFMFLYNKDGKQIDVYTLCFDGPENLYGETRRLAQLWGPDHIIIHREWTFRKDEGNDHEMIGRLVIEEDGNMRFLDERHAFDDFIGEWHYIKGGGWEDGVIEKKCDIPLHFLEFTADEQHNFEINIVDNFDGMGHNVEVFRKDEYESMYRAVIRPQFGGSSLWIRIMWGHPELDILEIRGMDRDDKDAVFQYASKSYSESGSIKVENKPCPSEQ